MFTLPQRNLSFQPNQQQQQQQQPYHHHHSKLKSTSSFMMHANARATLFSKQKQQQLQRRNHLFKVVGFILYSLGLVSLVLILLMAQRLESGNNRSFRVLLNFVRQMYIRIVHPLEMIHLLRFHIKSLDFFYKFQTLTNPFVVKSITLFCSLFPCPPITTTTM